MSVDQVKVFLVAAGYLCTIDVPSQEAVMDVVSGPITAALEKTAEAIDKKKMAEVEKAALDKVSFLSENTDVILHSYSDRSRIDRRHSAWIGYP